MRALLILTALFATMPSPTRADLVIVPVLTEGGTAAAQTTTLRAEVEQELAARRVTHLPAREAASTINDASREWRTPTAQQVARYRELVDLLLGGKAKRKRAVESMSELLKLVLSAPEFYASPESHSEVRGRDEVQAACLQSVEHALALHQDVEAAFLAEHCMVILNQAVTDRAVSPSVRPFFHQVDADLQPRETAEVLVKGAPEGCTAFLNGQPVGSPEARRWHVPAAQMHWVYVECPGGRRSRVHTPPIPRAGLVIVDIDVDFDQVLRADANGISLRYARAPRAEVLRSDLERLARELKVNEALAVERTGDHWMLQRSGSSITASLNASYGPAELAAALDTLLASPPSGAVKVTSADIEASSDGSEPTLNKARLTRQPRQRRSHTKRPVRWQPLVSGTVLTLGAAALVAGGVLLHKRHEDGQRLRADRVVSLPGWRDWVDQRAAPYALGTAGLVVSAAGAFAMMVSFEQDPPWWVGGFAGAAGVGLAAWGITDIVRGAACDSDQLAQIVGCSRNEERRDRGALVFMSSAPFFTAALTQVLLWATAPTSPTRYAFSVAPDVVTRSVSFQARGAW